jgi:hypothetical protein
MVAGDQEFMYDAFISHASEDKDKFVRQLAQQLKEKNLSIWYDEFSLRVGDSLRKSIDNGLKESCYGIVVLSPSFFEKKWPEWELNGLVQLQNTNHKKTILPIWHNITYDQICNYSPSLADIYAINSNLGVEYVVQKILEVIKPEGSSLSHAYQNLKDLGYNPPPASDEWWLNVLEYDGSDANVTPWSFFIGCLPETNSDRGKFIAQKVIQRKWQQVVLEENISQITKPEILLKIIDDIPGLKELLLENLRSTICYAPQLIIPGFGGFFEPFIEDLYRQSVEAHLPRSKDKGGTGLTTDKLSPSCDEELALRDPNFGYYDSASVTCNFVQGDVFGPSPKVYEHFEYLIWLLSEASLWLPKEIRKRLAEGFLDWPVWLWFSTPPECDGLEFKKSQFTGNLFRQVHDVAYGNKEFSINAAALKDLRERIGWSVQILKIGDEVDSLVEKLLKGLFLERYIDELRSQRERNKQ